MDCSHVVSLNFTGNGTTGSFFFLGAIGEPYVWSSSQWATSPMSPVSGALDGGNLDDAWPYIKEHCEKFPDMRGFAGWPYTLFYKQWDEDPEYDVKFIYWSRPAEDWAKVEFAFQLMRGVPPQVEQYFTIMDYFYGHRLSYSSDPIHWQLWVDKYKEYNNNVREYFSDKPNILEIFPMSIDYNGAGPLDIGNQICKFIGIENVANIRYPGPGTAGGERAGLINSDGWDEKFTERWNVFSPQVNW